MTPKKWSAKEGFFRRRADTNRFLAISTLHIEHTVEQPVLVQGLLNQGAAVLRPYKIAAIRNNRCVCIIAERSIANSGASSVAAFIFWVG